MLVMLACITLSAKAVSILYGPYLQAVTDSSATIMWVTDVDAGAWVEVGVEGDAQPKVYYESELGHKVCGRVHKVTVPHLKAGTKYAYKIFSQEVDSSRKPVGEVVAREKTAGSRPLTFKTLDPNKEKIMFTVVNDIHGKNTVLENLMYECVERGNDFILYNGDMVSHMNSEREIFGGFINTSVNIFAAEIPFYMCRGNHETRGSFAHNYMSYFPTTTGEPYFSFRHGPVYFILLDSGEDKPDTDIAYYDTARFDEYRQRQAEWLKGVVASDDFKNSPFKVVLIHQPLANAWHGGVHSRECFLPILNEAGIDLGLSAHTHRYAHWAQNPQDVNFPVIVNSNVHSVVVEADATALKVLVKNQNDETLKTFTYNAD